MKGCDQSDLAIAKLSSTSISNSILHNFKRISSKIKLKTQKYIFNDKGSFGNLLYLVGDIGVFTSNIISFSIGFPIKFPHSVHEPSYILTSGYPKRYFKTNHECDDRSPILQ